MAMNIPNQLPTGMASFNQGFKGMADFMHQLKQHQLEQQKLQELAKYHQSDIDLRKAAAGRAARAASLVERKEQPGYKVQKFLQEREMLRKALANRYPNMPGINNGVSESPGGQMPSGQPQKPSYGMGQGMMMSGGQMPAMGQDKQQTAAPMAPQEQQSGLISSGNIDLNNRPMVKNPQGGTSTVFTMGISEDGKHINIPRVSDDGRILTPQEAVDLFHKTGKHLGVYGSQQAADEAAKQLHQQQANQYGLNDQQPAPQVDAYGIDWNNPIDAMAAQNAGFKAPVETPAQKSARVISEKKAEEDYKNSQAAFNAQQKAEGKYQGETYGQAVDTAMGLGDIGHNLDYLVQRVEENPDAKNVIGPVNQNLTKLFGSKEDQQFLGQIMSSTGNIVLDAAKNIKGAFTGRDQTLIHSMKPGASDPYYVFIGKLRAMQELTHLAQERANIYADEVHNGVAPHRAIEIARQKTNMAEAGRKAEKQVQMARYKSDLQLGINPKFKTQEEKTEFLNSLSAKEKIQLLKTMGA